MIESLTLISIVVGLLAALITLRESRWLATTCKQMLGAIRPAMLYMNDFMDLPFRVVLGLVFRETLYVLLLLAAILVLCCWQTASPWKCLSFASFTIGVAIYFRYYADWDI